MNGDKTLREEILTFYMEQAPIMGGIALKYFGNINDSQVVKKKGHLDDPVTIADTEISDHIVSSLNKEFGERVILLSEESAKNFGYKRAISNEKIPILVVDELDGTLNFTKEKEHFSILLGMAETWRNGYEMTAGVIYKPLTREFYFATIDSDAMHITEDGEREVLQTSRNTNFLQGKTSVNVAIGRQTFPVDYPDEYLRIADIMKAFQNDNVEQVKANSKFSAGLEIMDVASGKVDVYLSAKAANWDYAAASLILEQANGCSYIARKRVQLTTPMSWTLQMDKPAAYYPGLFTNGHIDTSFFKHMKQYLSEQK
ncbi:MAG: hypothetical protein ISS25_02100 [Nanoarchaeota archaeon]|nr:hypothetical protein [DPANN group archaeon]MBL7116598.1 hypothetical protein [Nanoarchaeota archaeon]